jgi:hypothetical protein
LSPAALGTSEVMQAFATLQREASRGAGDRQALCQAIAARVAGDESYADVVSIRLVSATHDAVAYLADGTVGREIVRATCDVPRGPPGPGAAPGGTR